MESELTIKQIQLDQAKADIHYLETKGPDIVIDKTGVENYKNLVWPIIKFIDDLLKDIEKCQELKNFEKSKEEKEKVKFKTTGFEETTNNQEYLMVNFQSMVDMKNGLHAVRKHLRDATLTGKIKENQDSLNKKLEEEKRFYLIGFNSFLQVRKSQPKKELSFENLKQSSANFLCKQIERYVKTGKISIKFFREIQQCKAKMI